MEEMGTQPLVEKCLEKLLREACALLHEPFQAICDDIVNKYVPVLLEYLKEHVKPQGVCQFIRLCPK